MHVLFTLYVSALFVLLSPGVLVSYPLKGTLLRKVLFHSVVFAFVFYLTSSTAWKLSVSVEGFKMATPTPTQTSVGYGIISGTPPSTQPALFNFATGPNQFLTASAADAYYAANGIPKKNPSNPPVANASGLYQNITNGIRMNAAL